MAKDYLLGNHNTEDSEFFEFESAQENAWEKVKGLFQEGLEISLKPFYEVVRYFDSLLKCVYLLQDCYLHEYGIRIYETKGENELIMLDASNFKTLYFYKGDLKEFDAALKAIFEEVEEE